MRRSVSEAALAQPEALLGTDSLKALTIKDLGFKGSSETSDTPEMSLSMETLGPATPSDVNFFLRPENSTEDSSEATDDLSPMGRGPHARTAFPEGFHPRRSSQGVLHMPLYSAPIVKNPFMSPLLAPDSMLKTLPPVHIVVRARLAGGQGRRGGAGGGRPPHFFPRPPLPPSPLPCGPVLPAPAPPSRRALWTPCWMTPSCSPGGCATWASP